MQFPSDNSPTTWLPPESAASRRRRRPLPLLPPVQ